MMEKETTPTSMSTVKTDDVDLKTLVERVKEGIATEQETGVALKQLQISIVSGLVNDMSVITKSLDSLKDLQTRLLTRLEELIITDVDLMDVDTVMSLIKEIYKIQSDNLEFQRRVIQGKSLFDFQTLSEDEKMVVQLMSSFASLEEKREFLRLVAQTLNNKK